MHGILNWKLYKAKVLIYCGIYQSYYIKYNYLGMNDMIISGRCLVNIIIQIVKCLFFIKINIPAF